MADKTDLETAMDLLMTTFDKYACKEGRKDILSREEAKTLVVKELLLDQTDEEAFNKKFEKLDCDGDNEVNFFEFVLCVALATCDAHALKHKQQQSQE